MTSQHSLVYAELIDRHGEDKARLYAEANEAGLEKVAGLVDDLDLDCDLTRAPAYAYTRTAGQRGRIEAEVDAARRLGLPATLTEDVDLPFTVEAAVRFEEQIHFHPGKYLAGLARAITAAGGLIYDGTRVTDVEEGDGDMVGLTTGSGYVRAGQVVLATLLPPGLIGGYCAKTWPSRSYGLAMKLSSEAPQRLTISIDSPTRSTRPWGDDGLIVVGNGHEVGAEEDTESKYADLEDWSRSTGWRVSRPARAAWSRSTAKRSAGTATWTACFTRSPRRAPIWGARCTGTTRRQAGTAAVTDPRFDVDGSVLDGPAVQPLPGRG